MKKQISVYFQLQQKEFIFSDNPPPYRNFLTRRSPYNLNF